MVVFSDDDQKKKLSWGPRKRKRSQSSSSKQRLRKASFEKEGRKREVKRRAYYKKVVHGGEFAIGDDVYVKRREDASSDGEDPEGEECRICFKSGKGVMIECDDCLGGFHLRCLKPLMKEVPEGDWVCTYCEDQRLGKEVELPKLPEGIKQRRTAREKLLSSDLWAAYIESIWKETATDRQPRNLRRELYSINDFADIEYLLQTTMKKVNCNFDHNSSIGALAAVEQDALRRKDERVFRYVLGKKKEGGGGGGIAAAIGGELTENSKSYRLFALNFFYELRVLVA
ncbi:hypothetical protein ACLOJK_021362 [Asimina triloba]